MSDEQNFDQDAIARKMREVEASHKRLLEEFDLLVEYDDHLPLTAEEQASYKEQFKSLTSTERDEWALRIRSDSAQCYAKILREAADSPHDARPWQLNSISFFANVALLLTYMRFTLDAMKAKIERQQAEIKFLRDSLPAAPTPKKRRWWPPGRALGRSMDN